MTGIDIQWHLFGRLLLASLLGALIGLEREIHGRPAGFRTHLLVSLGSCLFVVTSIYFYLAFGNISGTGQIGVDPGRIAAQVVTGIGFLGAGAIHPREGFQYAYQSGADFLCVGMFDFQVAEDVEIARGALARAQQRDRAWCA